jgi:hypothetical protein
VRASGRPGQVADPAAALVLDPSLHVAVHEVLGTDMNVPPTLSLSLWAMGLAGSSLIRWAASSVSGRAGPGRWYRGRVCPLPMELAKVALLRQLAP